MQSVFSPIESIGLHLAKPERPKTVKNLINEAGSILKRMFFQPHENSLIQNGKLVIPDQYTQVFKGANCFFPKPNAETIPLKPESLACPEIPPVIYPLYFDICQEFFESDKGLLTPSLPIRAIKTPNKTLKLQTPKDVYYESLKTHNPDFDSSIDLILKSDLPTFTSIMLVLALSNPGFSTSKNDPGGINPEIVLFTNDSHEISTKVITTETPENLKIYIQKMRKAIAVRLADRSIYEGLLTSQLTAAKTTLIMGQQGIGKSTLTRKLSESLHINSLELNSPQKVNETLSLQPRLAPANLLIETPAFLINNGPLKKNEHSKIRFLVDNIARGMGLKDGRLRSKIKTMYLKSHEGNSSLTYSLVGSKGVNTLIRPFDRSLASTLKAPSTENHNTNKFDSIRTLITTLPLDILNTLMLAIVFDIPNLHLIAPFESPNLTPPKKALFSTLYSKQTSMIKNQGGDQDFSDLMAFLSPNYINIINNIENQFPMPSRAKTLFLNLIRQLGAFEAINSPIEEI